MRGWAIFVMVWVHSTWLALGADKVYMWSFAVVYPMPVFFAVSGYLWSYKNRPGVPWRRWLKMLVLLLVGSLGYALLFGEDAWGMFSDMYYYWFFAALLLCELCQYGLDRLALGRTARAALQVYIVGAVLLWNVFWWCMEDFGANRFGIPWADMESYWLFYAMGAMMGRDLKARRALTTWPMAAIGALLLAYGIYCGKGAGSPGGLAGGLGAVTLTWWAFRQLSIRTHRGASLLAWVGRQSLGVFLLSYPVLSWLLPLGLRAPRSWVDTTPRQWFAALAVAIPVTLLMAAATYLFKNFFKNLKFIHIQKI